MIMPIAYNDSSSVDEIIKLMVATNLRKDGLTGKNPTPSKVPTPSTPVGPLGVDLEILRDTLPGHLFARTTAALYALEEAQATSDPDKASAATTALVAVIAEIQAYRNEKMVNNMFANAPRVHGDRAVRELLYKMGR
jgi:hypothetical protein